jgi:hypothetical protein
MSRFSLALLIKKSASQLNYDFRHQAEEPETVSGIVSATTDFTAISQEQFEGNEFARASGVSKMVEMATHVTHGNDSIYFSFDEVSKRYKSPTYMIIEHKMYGEDSWYFQNSVIQVAAYRAFFEASSKSLKTALFYRQQNPQAQVHHLNLSDKPVDFFLNFGNTWYRVVCENKELRRFYMTKLRACKDYNVARRFDEVFKHKEWNHLWRHITTIATDPPRHSPTMLQ